MLTAEGRKGLHWIQQLIQETAAPQRRRITELREKLQEDKSTEKASLLSLAFQSLATAISRA